ncbi:hypothetical protein BD289DRAFT_30588 [Coniella lustricola]|uniref:Uncharacterized protein n=1 Tax=Coniella lustricola TaxID=2025994 RepID=A0A2T3A2W8_9PEZI|nr:hypothetical protein BD289DRAFT_30588 [Coniella lustricola]
METHTTEPSRLGFLPTSQPSSAPSVKCVPPLRVMKRSSSNLSRADSEAEDPDSKFRNFSQRTDTSLRSITEQPDDDEQLTIPKIRGNGNRPSFEYSTYTGDHAQVSRENVSMSQVFSPSLHSSIRGRYPQLIERFLRRYASQDEDSSVEKPGTLLQDRYDYLSPGQPSFAAYDRASNHTREVQSAQYLDMAAQQGPSLGMPCHNDGVTDDPFRETADECDYEVTPRLLVPEISITPDTRHLDNSSRNFWVAVELSVRLHRCGGRAFEDSSQCDTPRTQHYTGSVDFDLKEHGCLHDVQVEIKPTVNSRVLEVIEHEASPRSFIPGQKSLVLVNVELSMTNYSRLRGHVRSQSDELMEDLENQLGSAQCEYLKVNIIYRHSLLSALMNPGHRSACHSSGIIDMQTRICTTFTAATNRYNAASLWSPPPAPTPNRLLGIIAAH